MTTSRAAGGRCPSGSRWRAVLLVLVVAGCGSDDDQGTSGTTSTAGSDDAAARRYCTDQGGMLVDRTAAWNTNGDESAWLPLAGAMTFCEFESGEGHATTRISLDLQTLYSEEPTLAAVAYLSAIRPTLPDPPGPNPASSSCSRDLGGASTFGNTAAGGGWVNTDEPVFVVMNYCVFADRSAIDEFGIWYHGAGTIRGADLATKLRYRPGDELPAMFDQLGG